MSGGFRRFRLARRAFAGGSREATDAVLMIATEDPDGALGKALKEALSQAGDDDLIGADDED